MIRLGETPIAVIDVESTGLSPSQDRIVEIAVVRMSEDWMSAGLFETLVNPERDPGPTFAHGLAAEDLVDAPLFWEIAPELSSALDGCVIAAHNVNFDAAFLRYEFWRLGKVLPKYPLLDTARAGTALGRIIKGDNRSLAACCEREHVFLPESHTAKGDATATAELLRIYLQMAYTLEMDFADLAVAPLELCIENTPFRERSRAVPRK
jgi:DNA polymerase III epsilon subunit family exonuclease